MKAIPVITSILTFLYVTSASYLTSPANDLLSAFSWAALDLPSVGIDLLGPEEGLGLRPGQLEVTERSQRRRRQLLFDPNKNVDPINIEVEVRFILPMFQVFESDNMNFEVPYKYEMDWPEILRRSGGSEGLQEWKDTIGGMLRDFEDMVSLFGINGHGCVRRALCEMATLPPLRPQGIVGEMLDIFMRGIQNNTLLYENNFYNTTQENYDIETTTTTTTTTTATTATTTTTEKPSKKRRKNKEGKKRVKREEEEENEEENGITENGINLDYFAAGTLGKLDMDCAAAFSECPLSLMDYQDEV
ncbi:uncharacterized protein LOC135096191 [Scylla paramamosain]|uniref:uncharacterized protein LOC135096191 n=1 Tax=Scylla paramamosain TaxID=85552 RepID=UPI0030837B07